MAWSMKPQPLEFLTEPGQNRPKSAPPFLAGVNPSRQSRRSAFKLATNRGRKRGERVESIAAIPADQTWQFCLELRHFRGQLACYPLTSKAGGYRAYPRSLLFRARL